MMVTRLDPRSRTIVRATSVLPEPEPPAMPIRMFLDTVADANRVPSAASTHGAERLPERLGKRDRGLLVALDTGDVPGAGERLRRGGPARRIRERAAKGIKLARGAAREVVLVVLGEDVVEPIDDVLAGRHPAERPERVGLE